MNKRIVSFFFLLLFTGAIYAAIDITDLRTELLKSPEGIDAVSYTHLTLPTTPYV